MTISETIKSSEGKTTICTITENRINHIEYAQEKIDLDLDTNDKVCHQDKSYLLIFKNKWSLVEKISIYISASGGNSLSLIKKERWSNNFTIDGINFVNGQPQL